MKPSDTKMLIPLFRDHDFSASGNKNIEFDEVAVLGALLMTKYSETLIDEAIGYEDELYGWSNSKTIYYLFFQS